MWTISSPVTGGAQTGFTTPTYSGVDDKAPDVNGEQYAFTSVGGTQTGVRTHSISDPFTVTLNKPKVPKVLPSPNPVTGQYPNVPMNTYTFLVRKGVNIAANQAPRIMLVRCEINVPAGADAYDPANIRAAVSAMVGVLNQQSAGLGDSLVTGVT
jgi:hypothetical protein